ncbi:Regulator of MON1-CCZ1 complex [Nymphon striatum]|nr:Regulator of MON1-CCZ1 complex [Nymphon striatum]
MALNDEDQYFLHLSTNPVRFEPVSKVTDVFFDDANQQVFAVRSGGVTGVIVKGPDEKSSYSFRMEDKGLVISIKFSPDQKILAMQRSQRTVEFVNFNGHDIDSIEYSQTCKGKTTKILGFAWTYLNEVIFITDHGIELYQVIPEKRILKSIKSFSVTVNWFVYLPENGLLILSSGILGNIMQPFLFKPGAVFKIAKFEVDLPLIPKPAKLCLHERDVTLATIEGPAKKTDILKLDLSGRFAINIVDNLIIVHHQESKTSLLFDIKLPGESDGYVCYHHPVTNPMSIAPFVLHLPDSQNWVVFQPNIIIDAKLGCLWKVNILLPPLVPFLQDKLQLIDFLLLRRESKQVILDVLRTVICSSKIALMSLAKIFDKLNGVYQLHMAGDNFQSSSTSISTLAGLDIILIDQSDMYTHVFSIFQDNKNVEWKFVVAVLVEYIRSLNQFTIPVQHYLYELVINTLVQNNSFYQLHQFLQYHVLSDSKPLACLMLSLQNAYQPANQLALDMLKRLSTANEEIVEVLLSKHQVLQALRFIRSVGNIDSISSRKFLDAAMNTENSSVFYAVFKFFEQRNIRLRGSPSFAKGEHCEIYIKHFEKLFRSPSSFGFTPCM